MSAAMRGKLLLAEPRSFVLGEALFRRFPAAPRLFFVRCIIQQRCSQIVGAFSLTWKLPRRTNVLVFRPWRRAFQPESNFTYINALALVLHPPTNSIRGERCCT